MALAFHTPPEPSPSTVPPTQQTQQRNDQRGRPKQHTSRARQDRPDKQHHRPERTPPHLTTPSRRVPVLCCVCVRVAVAAWHVSVHAWMDMSSTMYPRPRQSGSVFIRPVTPTRSDPIRRRRRIHPVSDAPKPGPLASAHTHRRTVSGTRQAGRRARTAGRTHKRKAGREGSHKKTSTTDGRNGTGRPLRKAIISRHRQDRTTNRT